MSSAPDHPPSVAPAAGAPPEHKPGDVYCSNCGYVLTGLTDVARCPECGKPLVEVLTRVPFRHFGKPIRYRSEAKLFGIPVIDVALGAHPELGENKGIAKGIIAVGDIAIGGIAIGGLSAGIVSVGGLALGVSTIGGMSAGALTALGGCGVGGFAVGGGAIGGIAAGGGSLGIVAQGAGAVGVYARGAGVAAVYKITPTTSDPEAVKVFQALEPLLGRTTAPGGLDTVGYAVLTNASITALLALSVGLVAIFKLRAMKRQATAGGPR